MIDIGTPQFPECPFPAQDKKGNWFCIIEGQCDNCYTQKNKLQADASYAMTVMYKKLFVKTGRNIDDSSNPKPLTCEACKINGLQLSSCQEWKSENPNCAITNCPGFRLQK